MLERSYAHFQPEFKCSRFFLLLLLIERGKKNNNTNTEAITANNGYKLAKKYGNSNSKVRKMNNRGILSVTYYRGGLW
jgi:hypothetical protein